MYIEDKIKSRIRNIGRPKFLGDTEGIPLQDLLFYSQGGTTDSIGESTILYQSGDAATWATTAVWGFERTADMIAIDAAMGGNVLFVGTAVRYMNLAAWMGLPGINADYMFIGAKGAAGYSADQTALAGRINRVLNADTTLTSAELIYPSSLWTVVATDPNFVEFGEETITFTRSNGEASIRLQNIIAVGKNATYHVNIISNTSGVYIQDGQNNNYALINAGVTGVQTDTIVATGFGIKVGATTTGEAVIAIGVSLKEV